jgi:hypothetical protein
MLQAGSEPVAKQAGIGAAEKPSFHPTPEVSANFFLGEISR